jgi:asparagine synthase (glutamine-hydrolysing)
MCGISGALSWQSAPDCAAVKAMCDRQVHRGPDAGNVVARAPAVLGHRRLRVIDLSEAANQPMCDDTGRFWIVYNGELYNFRALRRELEASGTAFRTASDTEVILEAYKRWDLHAFERFNGMFALAIWDEAQQRLVLARDRAGEKPLYFAPLTDGGVVFASELHALRRHPLVSSTINVEALDQFLSLNYVLGSSCILQGVEKLEPAHYLIVERGRANRPVRYWDLAAHFHSKRAFGSEDEAAEAVGALVDDAVRLRLESDVPLGAFLSGGLDSSTIAAAMCHLRPPAQNETFSVGFAEATYDELPWARRAAAEIGVGRHLDQVVAPDMAAALPRIAGAADEPFADTSMIPVYFLAAFARQRVTVCLSGDGSDEIFAGYETYLADALLRATRWVPTSATRALARVVSAAGPVTFDKVSTDFKVRQFLRGHSTSPEHAHYAWRRIFTDEEKRELLRPEHQAKLGDADPFHRFQRFYDEVRHCHPLDQALYVDIKTWLPDDILVKVDRMTMAHALEARAPFLDHRLMELAASVPPRLKLNRRGRKYVLKQSQKRRLSPAILARRKEGFNAPVSDWLAGPLRELAQDATSPRVLGEFLRPEPIVELWDAHLARRADHGLKLFGLTCLGLWLQQATALHRRAAV